MWKFSGGVSVFFGITDPILQRTIFVLQTKMIIEKIRRQDRFRIRSRLQRASFITVLYFFWRSNDKTNSIKMWTTRRSRGRCNNMISYGIYVVQIQIKDFFLCFYAFILIFSSVLLLVCFILDVPWISERDHVFL